MKILPPKTNNELVGGVDRGQNIDAYITQKTKEYNEFKEEIERKRKEILDEFVAFSLDITGKKTALQGTFNSLEERKEVSYKGLSELSSQIHKKMKAVELRENEAGEKEKKLDERENWINIAVKNNNERDVMLQQKAEKLSAEEKRINEYNITVQDNADKITVDFLERENKITKKEQKVDNKLEELERGIEANAGVSKLLRNREQEFEKHMEEEKKILQDQRETLNRAWNELSTKQNGN